VSRLAKEYHKLGLAWTESYCLAWALWESGEDLGHAVSKDRIAEKMGINVETVRATLEALVQGGLLRERPPDEVEQYDE